MTGARATGVRRGFYLDSVALMRLSRSVAGIKGVTEAALMMGTPSNIRVMTDAGLLDDPGCLLPYLAGRQVMIVTNATVAP